MKGLISNTITIINHIQGWKKQKERVASVQKELIFNDFKAGSQGKIIAELDYLSRTIPHSKGVSQSSYKNVTDFQLLKKDGVYDVEAMRKIQPFSAVLNMNNEKIGKEVIRQVEEFDLIPDDQNGSRITALNKVIVIYIYIYPDRCGYPY